MVHSLDELERARLPASALGRLAAMRCENGLEVALHDRELWVRWPAGDDAVVRMLLPLAGCRLYGKREGRWHAWGLALPAFDVPEALRFRPLWQVIFPAPVQPQSAEDFAPLAAELALVADDAYRPTTALHCSVDQFLAWADAVPPCALERYRAAIQRERLFVLGKKLPWIERSERFWGQSVFLPIGFRTRPSLAEADLRNALGIAETDLAILRADGCEIVAKDCFAPLTHAALRLARQGETP